MKKRLPTFAAGMLTMTLIGSLGMGALAASGQMTITVDPISIQVNGQTFTPQDANGADVPVFALNGTTYAPLRALAEAYGLEVGYDAQANMATVSEPGDAPVDTASPEDPTADFTFDYSYEEFLGLWDISEYKETVSFVAPDGRARAWWISVDPTTREEYLLQSASEKLNEFGLASNLMCYFRDVDKEYFASVYWGEVHYKS